MVMNNVIPNPPEPPLAKVSLQALLLGCALRLHAPWMTPRIVTLCNLGAVPVSAVCAGVGLAPRCAQRGPQRRHSWTYDLKGCNDDKTLMNDGQDVHEVGAPVIIIIIIMLLSQPPSPGAQADLEC